MDPCTHQLRVRMIITSHIFVLKILKEIYKPLLVYWVGIQNLLFGTSEAAANSIVRLYLNFLKSRF